jgi:DNA (cytosine-5)-methyltransferase 1
VDDRQNFQPTWLEQLGQIKLQEDAMKHGESESKNRFDLIEFCAGVGGIGLGLKSIAKPVAAVELDKSAAGVYSHNHPDVPLFADLNNICLKDLPLDGKNLIIAAGTPCQAWSIAGKRLSLKDPRARVALKFNQLIKQIDEYRKTKQLSAPVVIWENVLGALSSKDNAFGHFLGGLVGTDGPIVPPEGHEWHYSGVVTGPQRKVGWRVLDSQFFGVAQRRRRIYAVSVGNSGEDDHWIRSLLPQSESLSGDTKPKRKKRSNPTSAAQGSFGISGFGQYVGADCGTLRSHGGDLGGGSEVLITGEIAEPVDTFSHDYSRTDGFNMVYGVDVYNGTITGDTTVTVTSATGAPNTSGPKVISWNGDPTPKSAEDISMPLRANQGGEGQGVAFENPVQMNPTLEYIDGKLVEGMVAMNGAFMVRRLTPIEVMRLQSWPDDHCKYRDVLKLEGNRWIKTGKTIEQKDTPIYKQAGNGVTSNVVAWIVKQVRRHSK